MTQTSPIVMSILFTSHGAGRSAWLYPGAVDGASTSIAFHAEWAKKCEEAVFDLFFIADTPASRTDNLEIWSKSPLFQNVFEPVTLLSSLAMQTSRIGLGATVSTSFFEPFNIARQFASLDHLSGGRAAWNVVTSANDYAARNFGLDRLPAHAERYEKARESLDLVRSYWDTWEDDAFVDDHAAQMHFDPDKYHATTHDGRFFKVHGGLNIARSPQGQPVIIQAGASEAGRELAAETAEVVFGTGADFAKAKAFYDDLKGRMAKFGREKDELKVLSGIAVCVAETTAEAEAKMDELRALVHPSVGLATISFHLEFDFSKVPLDEPIPVDQLPKSANLHKAFFDNLMEIIRANPGITPRQLYQIYDRGTPTICGSPTEIADVMQERFEGGSCDGFMLLFNALPAYFDDFNRLVLPELRRRGLFREDYSGTTLRDHLGLQVPVNRHVAAKPALEPT